MREINYEDLLVPSELREAEAEYLRIYEGLEHLCDFEWFYEFIWKRKAR